MMVTAVHEGSTADSVAHVVFGTPLRRIRSPRGVIALFAPGSVVGYRIRRRRYAAGCVFRAAANAAHGGDVVPGVSPAPSLLIGFARGRRFDRALALLRELRRRELVDALSDAAYLRAAFALGRPHFDVGLLVDTLEEPWIS